MFDFLKTKHIVGETLVNYYRKPNKWIFAGKNGVKYNFFDKQITYSKLGNKVFLNVELMNGIKLYSINLYDDIYEINGNNYTIVFCRVDAINNVCCWNEKVINNYAGKQKKCKKVKK